MTLTAKVQSIGLFGRRNPLRIGSGLKAVRRLQDIPQHFLQRRPHLDVVVVEDVQDPES